jgi:hypothetical protein
LQQLLQPSKRRKGNDKTKTRMAKKNKQNTLLRVEAITEAKFD